MASFQAPSHVSRTVKAQLVDEALFYVITKSPQAAFVNLRTRAAAGGRGFHGLLGRGFDAALWGYTNNPDDGFRAKREVVGIYDRDTCVRLVAETQRISLAEAEIRFKAMNLIRDGRKGIATPTFYDKKKVTNAPAAVTVEHSVEVSGTGGATGGTTGGTIDSTSSLNMSNTSEADESAVDESAVPASGADAETWMDYANNLLQNALEDDDKHS